MSILLSGAIFGFFYAWVCSTMWGLDQLPENTAIAAMQAMNASVRNSVFAPAFFGTPFVLMGTAFFAWRARAVKATIYFALGGLLYLIGGMGVTMVVNVPMNEALALVKLPLPAAEAATVWQDYSAPWQIWNQIRTGVSGVTLGLAALGFYALGRQHRRGRA